MALANQRQNQLLINVVKNGVWLSRANSVLHSQHLRNAANAIGNLKESTPLRDFFHRINFRKGRVSAITATARKLAVIIWNMVVKKTPYENPKGYLYLDQKRKLGLVKRIQKQINKFGLTNEDLQININHCNTET